MDFPYGIGASGKRATLGLNDAFYEFGSGHAVLPARCNPLRLNHLARHKPNLGCNFLRQEQSYALYRHSVTCASYSPSV